jgi:hypothetical protein
MATSGSKQIDIYSSWLWLKYSWWQTSQSIADNTTTIGWKLELTSGNGALYKSDRTWTVVNDGAKHTGQVKISLDKYSTQQIASGTSVIKHNSDGSKTFTYSFSQQFELTLNSGAYMGTYSGNGNDTLTTIKRASQPSLVTYPNSTQNVGEFGKEFSIHMNTASQDFRHVVRYEYGDRKGQIASNVVNGTTWAVPLDFMNDIPNATSGSGRIYADTYHNNVLIGTKYTGFTVNVPSNIKPSCSIQVLDNTPHGAYYGKLVKGLSKIYVKTTFKSAYSSPVDRYQVTANGVNYSAAEVVTGLISKAGTNTVTAKVTDKRGRTSEAVSYSFDVLDYSPPSISALSVKRCKLDEDMNYVNDTRGDHIRVIFSASITPLDNKNTSQYKVLYKKSTDAQYTEEPLYELLDEYSAVNHEFVFEASPGKSYDVSVLAIDRHNTTTKSAKAPTAKAIYSLRGFRKADGTVEDGFGFGKVPEKPNVVQFGYDAEFEGAVKGKAVGLGELPKIPEGADLNDYLDGGMWSIESNAIAETIANMPPYKAAGRLIVCHPTGVVSPIESVYGYLEQIFLPYDMGWGGMPWMRYCNKRVETSYTMANWVSMALLAYPVGSIYIAYNHINPADRFGGTWERMANTFLWGTDASGTIGQTGGEKTHTLTANELPSHTHGAVYTGTGATDADHQVAEKKYAWYTASGSAIAYGYTHAGNDQAHNNMPPYTQVSIWRRIA